MEININTIIAKVLGYENVLGKYPKIKNETFNYEQVIEIANRTTKHFETTIEDVTAENEQYQRDFNKAVDLLHKASNLIGHPATNQSATIDIACENWQKEFNLLNEK
jgi:hypothetical protein